MPVAIFLLIAAITIVSVVALQRGEDEREAASLRTRAGAIASALERRANSSSAFLRAGAAFLASIDEVPSSRFRRFVSELRLDADYRGGEGIGWAMVVRPGEIGAFDELMAADAPGKVTIYPMPDGRQPYAVPVTYLQPDTERNRRALGFDMYSEPVRRRAMMDAERNARPTASSRVVLQQEGNGEAAGFLIYMPVFGGSAEGRILRGFIYSPFNAQDFLSSALELEHSGGFGIRLYDGAIAPDNLLAQIGETEDPGKRAMQDVNIAGRVWVLEVTALESGTLSGLSMATLIFGMLVASLLMLLVRLWTRQALEDEAALRWFEEQASIRNSLTRELNHRVKNTLANVLSIIALTRRRAESLDDFADSLDGRIRALSATHDLLTRSDWGTTPVRSVIEAEAQSRNCRRVWVSMASMIADWPETVRRITDGLDMEWPMERNEAISEVGPLLKPRLCHGVPPESQDATLPRFSLAAWAAIEHGLAGNEPAAQAAFDGVRAALNDLDRTYERYQSALTAMRTPLSRRLTAPLRALRRLARCG